MSSKLENWIHRISEHELPIFKYTVNTINNVVANEDSSIADLAQIILRDASLTARVLRVANSVAYNVTGSSISTISKAIVYTGFNLVRDISMSLAVIDALLSGKSKEHEMQLMAKSFHTAVQARDFAERHGDAAAEEVFIAALLSNIGEMTFWCVASEEGDRINELMEQQDFSAEMAQREVLGFTFDQLTLGLTQDWHLSDLLHNVIINPKMKNQRVQDIILSKKLSDSASISWESKTTDSIANQIATHINVEKDKIKSLLINNAEKAAEVAQLFGAASIVKYLPISKEVSSQTTEDESTFNSECPEPDPLLQLDILRDLSGMLETNPDFNLILEIILEGIYRGVGLDRTVFALLTPDKKAIKAKYALGKDNQDFIKRFQFNLQREDIFTSLIKNAVPNWIKDTQAKEISVLVSEEIRLTLASKAFYIAPVSVAGRFIGLIYADRQASNRELDITSYDGFKHFVQQANQALEFISLKKH